MDGWSLFRKFSSRVQKRRSKAPATHSAKVQSRLVDAPTMTSSKPVPETQSVLLLYGPKQPYEVVENYPVPKLKNEAEVLVKTSAIGLNPIDWKAPDYNFAIPELPYLSGRESSGDVCQVFNTSSRLKVGDRVRLSPDDLFHNTCSIARYSLSSGHRHLYRLPRSSEGSVPGIRRDF